MASPLSCASPEIEALTDLWLQALEGFLRFYRKIPESDLLRPLGREETALTEGSHVMRAGLCHVTWACETAGLPGPEKDRPTVAQVRAHQAPLATRREIVDEGERLGRIIPPALAPLTNDLLSRHGQTWWKETMSVEGMLEHAILHFHRHQRQLSVRHGLGIRKAAHG